MRFGLILLLTLLTAGYSLSHENGDHSPDMRVWKDSDGLFEIEASFVMARDGKVQLLKHDGSLVWVPIEKLSAVDQSIIAERLAAIRLLNGELANQTPGPLPLVVAMVGLALLAGFGNILRKHTSLIPVVGMAILCTFFATAADKNEDRLKSIQKHFEPFKDKVRFRADQEYFYIESNGMPDHRMMVGITAWQQQVPLAQAYTGRNAWQIPLHPKFSDRPFSAKKALFRGAIALAVNGVPIFNPIKNDGLTDTFLAGELDEFGGHCGRADDYHYHIGPVHLEKIVGKGHPIAYALDGYPIYGYTDASGKEPRDLDEYNGRMEQDGYRYYSTKKNPYINGGMRGVVTVREDQIDPQPRAYSPRPALQPLHGAKITEYTRDEDKKSAVLTYEQNGRTGTVQYMAGVDKYTFTFKEPSGKVTTETYPIRNDGRRPPPPKKDGPPPKKGNRPAPDDRAKDAFILNSPAFSHHGKMPADFTGDGDGISPPLQWQNAPSGTKSFAIQLWHKPQPDGDEVKSYWVLGHIPSNVSALEKNSKNVGIIGINDKRRNGYDPMNSKGPGEKEYHITIYALSDEPKLSGKSFTRADLLKAIQNITLAESTLSCTYERRGKQ